MAGFEPAAHWSQTSCATKLRYSPKCTASHQFFSWCERGDLNPHVHRTLTPEASASTNSATLAMSQKNGVANGARTHDNWNHNPGLYQLSYSHHCGVTNWMGIGWPVHSRRFFDLGSACTTQPLNTASGRNGAPGRIRTCDHPLRRRMLYPAELRALSAVAGVDNTDFPPLCLVPF